MSYSGRLSNNIQGVDENSHRGNSTAIDEEAKADPPPTIVVIIGDGGGSSRAWSRCDGIARPVRKRGLLQGPNDILSPPRGPAKRIGPPHIYNRGTGQLYRDIVPIRIAQFVLGTARPEQGIRYIASGS